MGVRVSTGGRRLSLELTTSCNAHRVNEDQVGAAQAHDSVPNPDTELQTDQVTDTAGIGFTCPRCRLQVLEEFYGPCSSCRTTLRVQVGGHAREVEDVAYEPKMNVTPNAVATKE